jgi:hypothetical protein
VLCRSFNKTSFASCASQHGIVSIPPNSNCAVVSSGPNIIVPPCYCRILQRWPIDTRSERTVASYSGKQPLLPFVLVSKRQLEIFASELLRQGAYTHSRQTDLALIGEGTECTTGFVARRRRPGSGGQWKSCLSTKQRIAFVTTPWSRDCVRFRGLLTRAVILQQGIYPLS